MMRPNWIALAAALLLTACAIPAVVDSYTAPEAKLGGLRSFAWKPGDFVLPQFPDPALRAEADRQLRAAIDEELRLRGYERVDDAAKADFLVSFQVAGQQRVVVEERPRFGAPSANQVLTPGGPPLPAASELPRAQTVRDGSVTVFMHEPGNDRLFWRGTVNAEDRAGSNRAMVRKAVGYARDIVRQFPARAG